MGLLVTHKSSQEQTRFFSGEDWVGPFVNTVAIIPGRLNRMSHVLVLKKATPSQERSFEVNMSKEKVLHDPIAYHQRVVDIQFQAPRKEQTTTGRYMPAGSDYGKGYNNPVGRFSPRSMQEGPIPQESVAFLPNDAVRK